MSRVGKMPIAIPAGVTVTVTPENVVTVKGPKGELVKAMHKDINIAVEDAQVVVTRPSDVKEHRALHGLTRALLNNRVKRSWIQSSITRKETCYELRIFTSSRS